MTRRVVEQHVIGRRLEDVKEEEDEEEESSSSIGTTSVRLPSASSAMASVEEPPSSSSSNNYRQQSSFLDDLSVGQHSAASDSTGGYNYAAPIREWKQAQQALMMREDGDDDEELLNNNSLLLAQFESALHQSRDSPTNELEQQQHQQQPEGVLDLDDEPSVIEMVHDDHDDSDRAGASTTNSSFDTNSLLFANLRHEDDESPLIKQAESAGVDHDMELPAPEGPPGTLLVVVVDEHGKEKITTSSHYCEIPKGGGDAATTNDNTMLTLTSAVTTTTANNDNGGHRRRRGGARAAAASHRKGHCRCVLFLAFVALLLTGAVAALVYVTFYPDLAKSHWPFSVAASTATATTNNATMTPAPTLPKDPPLDVTAPPPTTFAPIVPGSPTMAPSRSSAPSTVPTTNSPTASPVAQSDRDVAILQQLVPLLQQAGAASDDPTVTSDLIAALDDATTIYHTAYRFLGRSSNSNSTSSNLAQRFAVALLSLAVGGNYSNQDLHECDWRGITCNRDRANNNNRTKSDDGIVTDVVWPDGSLRGTLPTMGLHLLTGLTTLDLANNRLAGSIPETLYDATNLRHLYLHDNAFIGTLSTKVGRLVELRRIYLGNNDLTGSLPQQLGSPGLETNDVQPLEIISLYANQFSGSIPRNWNLRYLYYLDLGRNRLTGRFPTDWTVGRSTTDRLRLLYLDHNLLTGSLPSNLGTIGNGRLNVLTINDNAFTGTMPLFNSSINFLNRLEIHRNNFTAMDQFMCAQIVYNGGELVQMRADCVICPCSFYCGADQCYGERS